MELNKHSGTGSKRLSKTRRTVQSKPRAAPPGKHAIKAAPPSKVKAKSITARKMASATTWSKAVVSRLDDRALVHHLLDSPPANMVGYRQALFDVLTRVRQSYGVVDPSSVDQALSKPSAAMDRRASDAQSKALSTAKALGVEALAGWVSDGVLVGTPAFAKAWGVQRQTVDAAIRRGDLFSVMHAGRHYLLNELSKLPSSDVYTIVRALGTATGAEKLMWWMRPHGGIGCQTPVEALSQEPIASVARLLELAQAWAEEHGQTHSSRAA